MFHFTVTVFACLLGLCYAKPEPIVYEQDPGRNHFLHPYVVGIEIHGEHFCGGSLIRPAVVLTAAHCISGRPISSLQARAGSMYRNKGGQTRTFQDYVMHPDYKKTSKLDYDVAVVQLSLSFDIRDSNIAVIALAHQKFPARTQARVSGWGNLGRLGNYQYYHERMTSDVVTLTSESYCKKFTSAVLDPKICAGCRQGFCGGDSGGSLVVNAKQIGVATHMMVENYTYEHIPHVYTDVVFLRKWIDCYANSYQASFS